MSNQQQRETKLVLDCAEAREQWVHLRNVQKLGVFEHNGDFYLKLGSATLLKDSVVRITPGTFFEMHKDAIVTPANATVTVSV